MTSFFVLLVFLCPTSGLLASTDPVTENVSITARVGDEVPEEGGGAAGGGYISPTSVIFTGLGYPGAVVYVLKEGVWVASDIADQYGVFYIALSGIGSGTTSFSIGGQDGYGNLSPITTYSLFIPPGMTTTITGIIIPPTLSVSPTTAASSEEISFFGMTQPHTNLTLSIAGGTQAVYTIVSDSGGAYLFTKAASTLSPGSYTAVAARDTYLSSAQSFSVTLLPQEEPSTPGSCYRIGDFTKDCKVTFLDFFILRYWYLHADPPAKLDLSGDGSITMQDFSILAHYWTG